MKVVCDPPWEASRCKAIDFQARLEAADTLDLPLHSSRCQHMSGMSKYANYGDTDMSAQCSVAGVYIHSRAIDTFAEVQSASGSALEADGGEVTSSIT